MLRAMALNSSLAAMSGAVTTGNARLSGLCIMPGANFSLNPPKPDLVVGEVVTHRSTQNVAPLEIVELGPVAPAIGIQKFDLFGRLTKPFRRPKKIRTRARGVRRIDIFDDFEGERVSADVG